MKKIYKWFNASILMAFILLVGCSTDESNSPSTAEDTLVRFTIGGSPVAASLQSSTNISRATEIQTSDEKKVSSLWAVVFTDEAVQPGGGTNDVSDTDKFYKSINIDLTGVDISTATLSFNVGREGNYQVCFIANPDNTLQQYLSLGAVSGVTTVQEFKRYIATQPCDNKTSGLLMTSRFYPAVAKLGAPYTIGQVNMTRAMARIDLYSKAMGLTINRVIFQNRATTTRLYQGNIIEWESGVSLGNKTYNLSLSGNVELPSSFKETIYTYEQKATAAQTEYQPELRVVYTLDTNPEEGEKEHIVKFVKTDNQIIPLLRNYLYKVTFTLEGAMVLSTISALDWNTGEEVSVGPGDIGDGTDVETDTGNANSVNLGDGGSVDVEF